MNKTEYIISLRNLPGTPHLILNLICFHVSLDGEVDLGSWMLAVPSVQFGYHPVSSVEAPRNIDFEK